jgi:hypothetical protein
MTHPVATWQDVVERRKALARDLFDPLTKQEVQILDYLLAQERAHLNLAHPPIVTDLIRFLEDHVS